MGNKKQRKMVRINMGGLHDQVVVKMVNTAYFEYSLGARTL